MEKITLSEQTMDNVDSIGQFLVLFGIDALVFSLFLGDGLTVIAVTAASAFAVTMCNRVTHSRWIPS